MAARRLDNFAPVFQRLTQAAVGMIARSSAGSEPLWRIPCRSNGEAVNVMMQLRQYWKALIAARERGDFSPEDPRLRLAEEAPLLATRTMRGNKATVEVVHRDQLQVSMALAQSLNALDKSLADPVAQVAPARPAVAGPRNGKQEILIDEAFGGAK